MGSEGLFDLLRCRLIHFSVIPLMNRLIFH